MQCPRAKRGLPKGKYGGGKNWNSKLGVKRWASLQTDLYANKGSLSLLSRKYGITKERVRQIAKGLGVTYYTKAEKSERTKTSQALRTAELRAQRQAAARARAESNHARRAARAALIGELLKGGISISALAKKLGYSSTPALVTRISVLRRSFPDLLPRRTQSTKVKTPENHARARLIGAFIRAGAYAPEIAKKLGVSSGGTLRKEIARLRRLYPNLLPLRRPGQPPSTRK
jgi:transposase